MADKKAGAPVAVDPNALVRNRPIAPCLWISGEQKDSILSLPLASLRLVASFHVSTAICKLTTVWVNTSGRAVDALFSFPLRGTVTASRVRIGDGRYLETQVVSTEDAAKAAGAGGGDAKAKLNIPSATGTDVYIPDLFRLPVANIGAGEMVTVEAQFIEPLDYQAGRYQFNVGMTFGPGVMPVGARIVDIIDISGHVDAFVPNIQVYSSSHGLLLTPGQGLISFRAQPADINSVQPTDFNLSFNMPGPSIIGTLIKEPDAVATTGSAESGSFILMVTPPSPDKVAGAFLRNFVFILDRSGSMVGTPYDEAVRALQAALGTMRQGDGFTLVAFDHKMECFAPDIVPATPQSINDCLAWARAHGPNRGTTEIGAPLQWSLQLLSKYNLQSLCFAVLLTDGCVANEREICAPLTQANSALGNSRILTFGIGSYCNWYFLKTLALLGRGFSDVCVDMESIFPRVTRLVEACAMPVLTGVDVAINGLDQLELYPAPLPDLFVGQPLMVAGKYRGRFPDRVTLSGTISTGQKVALEVLTMLNPTVPVNSVFVKQRLDLLTARAWLTQDKKLEAEIIKLSVMESMPCTYTTMVAYEVNDTRKAEIEAEQKSGGDNKDSTEISKPKGEGGSGGKTGRSAGTVAAVAVGGVLVIGAAVGAAIVFGNAGATAANLAAPVFSVLGGVGKNLLGLAGQGLGAAAKAVGSCGNCACCGCCGDLFKHCGGCGGCGDCLHSIEGVCGHCCSNVFGCVGRGCSSLVGTCCKCNCWGSIGSVLGSCCGPLFKCCGGIGGAVVGCCGKICSGGCFNAVIGCCKGTGEKLWPCIKQVCCCVCKAVFRK